MIGQTFSHYQIVEQIGAGGMGIVYRARDLRLDRDVALKVLPAGTLADEDARRRFRHEALALSKLNHSNIAIIHDFDHQDGVDFVVMECIRGVTMAQRLADGPLPEHEVAAFGAQIAAALEEAHEHGIIHRDLKPGNIMLTAKGQAKVLDFGLAKVLRSEREFDATTVLSATAPLALAGTLPYMSPEQLLGADAVDARTDVWAAGAVLYEMAAGRRAFPQTHGPVLIDAILNRSPQSLREINPRISPALENIVVKALDKDPARRYQTARELLVDLQRLTPSTSSIAWPQPTARRSHVGPLWALGCILVLALAIWVGVSMRRALAPASTKQAILIGDFENRTGDSLFDRTLRELMAASLEQSRYVSVYPPSLVPNVLQRMQRPATTLVDEIVGREICEREGLQAVLLGSINRTGNGYLLAARAMNLSGGILANAEQTASDASGVPAALDVIVRSLRTGLGESLNAVRETSAPLEQVTSRSLNAVRYFSLGKERLYASSPQEAITFFTKALELDPEFAMAHEYLGVAYTGLNDPVRAVQHMHDATLLANRVTEVEKLKIFGDYHQNTGNYDEAAGYYKVLAELRPKDPAPRLNLGICYEGKFDFQSALSVTEEAIRLVPYARPKVNLARLHFLQGNPAKAVVVAQEVLRELPDDIEAKSTLAKAYLVLGRPAESRRIYEEMVRAGGDPETEGRAGLSDMAMAGGRYAEARGLLEAAASAAEQRGNTFAAVKDRLLLAELALRADSTRQLAAALSRIDRQAADPVLVLLAGRLFARSQARNDALAMLHRMEDLLRTRQVTPQLRSFQALLQAELELPANPGAAVQAAESAVGHENSTFAVETLARAYAAAARDGDAIREYERVLARGNERSATYDAPAFNRVVDVHYQLGALYQNAGQPDRARMHLQTFLNYWSEAGSALPQHADARRRLNAIH